jgi:hypothetical protein
VSIAGKCPWDACSLLLRTSVTFSHNESLSSGELVYKLYQFADAIAQVVDRQIEDVNVLYVGPRDVAAKFGITLNGVPQGVAMTAVQQQYFADVTVDFLSASPSGRVLDLQIDKQIDNGDSIQVVGRLLGASYRPATAFASELETAFYQGQDLYVQKLITERLRPHAINEIGGIEFFEGISSVGGRVDADTDVPTPAPLPGQGKEDDGGGGGGSAMLIVAAVAAIGGLVLIGFLCWWCRRRARLQKEKKEARGYREKRKLERRSRRDRKKEEAKEKLLYDDEDPEQPLDFRETITPTPEKGFDDELVHSSDDSDRQSVVATPTFDDEDDFSDANFSGFPEDAGEFDKFVPTTWSDNNEKGVVSNSDKVPSPGETSGGQEIQLKADDKEAPTNERNQSPTPVSQEDTKLSSFMKDQPALPVDKMIGSRSVQLQPSTKKSAMSKKVKEAEDVPSGSSRKRPPVRGKSLDKDIFRGMLDEDNDKPGTVSNAPVSAKQKGASAAALSRFAPAKAKGASQSALSRFMKAKPEPSANKMKGSRSVQLQPSMAVSAKSKKVKEAEDVPPGSSRKRPPVRGKSLDEDVFRGMLGESPASTKAKGASPTALPTSMKAQPEPSANNLLGSCSEHQPIKHSSAKSKKVKEAEDVRQGSQEQRPRSKSFEDDPPKAPPQKRTPPRATKSLDEIEFEVELGHNRDHNLGKIDEDNDKAGTASEAPASTKAKGASPTVLPTSMKAQPEPSAKNLLGSRSEHQPTKHSNAKSKKVKEAEDVRRGSQEQRPRSKSFEDDPPKAPPQKRTPPRATKSLDEIEFELELGHNRDHNLGKIDEAKEKANDKAGTALSMKAQPEPSANNLLGSRSEHQPTKHSSAKSKKVKEAEDVRQKRAPPPKATKSMDGNEFRSKLGHNPYHGEIDPTMVDTGPQPMSKRTPPKPTKSLDGNEFRIELVQNPMQPHKRSPPRPTKSMDGNEFKRELVQNPIPYKYTDTASSILTWAATEPTKSLDENEFKSKVGHNSTLQPQQLSPPQRTKSMYGNEYRSELGSNPKPHPERSPPKPTKSLDENGFRRGLRPNPMQPQQRTPPKKTKSMDGNEFRRELVQNPMQPQKLTPPQRTKSMYGNEYRSELGSNPKPPPERSPPKPTKSLDENGFRRGLRPNPMQPQQRTPPKKTKSMDGNEFRRELVQNPMQPQKRTPPQRTKSMYGNEYRSELGSNPKPPPERSPPKPTKSLDENGFRRGLRPNPMHPQQRTPPKKTKSMDGNEFRRELVQNPMQPQKRTPPKPTKSMDGNEFRRELVQNPMQPLKRTPPKKSKSMDGNEFRSELRSNPMQPQDRSPPIPTKSLDDNGFRRGLRLNPTPIPYLQSRIDEGNDRPGTDVNDPTVVDTGAQHIPKKISTSSAA